MKNKFNIDYILLILILAFLSIIFFCGCNPSKIIKRQNENINELKSKFEFDKRALAAEAVAEYLKSNPCIFPEIDLDSLCYLMYKDADEQWRIIAEKGNSNIPDTIKINDTLRIYYPQKKILIPVPDKRYENLLKDSVIELNKRLGECNAKAVGRKEVLSEIKTDRWTVRNWWFLIALGLFLSWVIFIVIKLIK